MMGPSEVADGDWKQRCEQLQFKHQLDLERIRLCYDHELREKVTGKTNSSRNQIVHY